MNTKTFIPLAFAPVKEEDLRAVLRLERCSFVRPWTSKVIESYFQKSRSDIGRKIVFLTAWLDNTFVGYCVWVYRGERNCVLIRRLVVLPELRRKGFGTQLLRNPLARLDPKKLSFGEYFIEAENLRACLFLRANGFRVLENSIYVDGGEFYRFRFCLHDLVQLDDCELEQSYYFRHKSSGDYWEGSYLGMLSDLLQIGTVQGIIGVRSRDVRIYKKNRT